MNCLNFSSRIFFKGVIDFFSYRLSNGFAQIKNYPDPSYIFRKDQVLNQSAKIIKKE